MLQMCGVCNTDYAFITPWLGKPMCSPCYDQWNKDIDEFLDLVKGEEND